MSFFGQNNNNQPSSGFGGFGSNNNNTTSGFGQPATSGTGFGSGTTGTSGGFSGFGSGGTSGFGSNNNTSSLFGQSKPAFGAATTGGGGLFGSSTTTANSGGFGGFGSNNTNTASSGGLFGSTTKPAFGSGSTGGGLFGNANTGGFGSTNNQPTNAFGSSTALSQNNAVCEGTGSTPFTAYTEKEGTSAMTNHFQSISFMAPYKNFSFEELRFADYNQGRRYGNGSGQAGAFGSTNFGGFGQSNNTAGGFGQPASTSAGGLFGSTTATSAPFGSNQNSGFGASNSGSSLFGQKPGGLFGAASSSGTTTGLFGTSNNTTGGFGSGGTGGGFGTGSGGLFGQNNNQQQQSKPFSFGSTTATTGGGFGSGGTGFGSTNNNTNTGGGLFGSGTQANSNPFGQQNNAQTNTQPSNPFGGFGQQNQNQNQSSNSNPFGGFGQQNSQEQKPGGLFGNSSTTTNAGGGLFGNQNNAQPSGGLFGQTNNNQSTGSSLFGQKPAMGGGLFGQTNANTTNTGGGLFGGFGNNNTNQNQSQQNQGGGLFGNNNNTNQPKPGGLFGSTTANTGSGLFGNATNNNNQQPGGSLFSLGGSNNQQQQQQQPAGGSLFGNSMSNTAGSSLFGNPQQQQQPAPQNQFQPAQTLQTSITDPNAFGSPSIFSGLPPPPQVSGPIATPISQKSKQKKNALMPYYKLTPSTTSRLQTPQKRGFGFSYSTYGTPGSASSNASTPGGLSSSLLHSSFGRTLGKSLSTSNLRGSYGDSDSILTPGAFSAGSSRYGGAGSMKKLTIDRSLRTDLFGDRGTSAFSPSPEKERQPGILKKKVSFDASTLGGNGEQQSSTQNSVVDNGESSGSATPSAEEQGFLRSPRNQNKSKTNGVSSQPEMEQVRGNELAIVPEDESTEASSVPTKRPNLPKSQADQKAGEYWMNPSKESLQKLTKEQRRQISGFSVGREGCGKVEFNQSVDISNISLNDIYDKIIVIGLRSLTVYPDQARKPPMGKGLNVPSTIYLENSWPRQRDKKTPLHEKSGIRYNKHVERLRRVTGTEFVTYDKDTGTWIFKVPHFTTYGFDYDDDASEIESLHLSNSTMTEPPDTPTPKTRVPSNGLTPTVSTPVQIADGYTNGYSQLRSEINNGLGLRDTKPLPGSFEEAPMSEDEAYDQEMEEISDDEESSLDEHLAASPTDSGEDEPSEMQDINGESEAQSLVVRDEDAIMDLEMAGAFPEQDAEVLIAPALDKRSKEAFNISGDWARELQRTIRPRMQDRQALRKAQMNSQQPHNMAGGLSATSDTEGDTMAISTSADVYHSLYGGGMGQARPKKGKSVGLVTRRTITKSSPSASKNHAGPEHAILETDRAWDEIASGMKSKYITRLSQTSNLTTEMLFHQRAHTAFAMNSHVPMAQSQLIPFDDMFRTVQPDSTHEKSIWTLASILFDDQNCEAYGVPKSQDQKYDARIRKDRLILFWRSICEEEALVAANDGLCDEERAIAFLSANKVVEACESLAQGRNYRLATLVAQIGGNQTLHDEIATQICAWRDLNVLSEMSEPIRGLYSLLAGNTCICEGKQSQHIEDKARTFPLSERFKLDWKRAFGLRLYYSIKTEEPIEAAVSAFAQDLENDEPAKPGDDMLYSLLQVYAGSKNQLPLPSLGHILLPPKSSLSPLTPRISFQLYQALTLRFPSAADPATADTLAKMFAVQLDAAGEWLLAMFSLLHVTASLEREQAIKALLAHHANDIDVDPPVGEAWKTLIQEFKIPEAWIWQAKAIHARLVAHDRMRETNYLVKAGQQSQAHDVFKGVVGPECVIGEEWAQLQGLLEAFLPVKDKINGWGLGGQIYSDYLTLVMDKVEGNEQLALLNRMLDALPTMMHNLQAEKQKSQRTQADVDEKAIFKETVALQEISRVVAKEVLALREKGIEAAKRLHLPANKDAYLEDTIDLCQRYYKSMTKG